MIKRLRRNFTLISTAGLFLLLLIIMVSVNLLNYTEVAGDADAILDLLAENGGSFFGNARPDDADEPQERPSEQRQWPAGQRFRRFTPETQYETRFFSAFLGADGEVKTVDVGRIAAVDGEAAAAYAARAVKKGAERGFDGVYRYIVRSAGDGSLVIFVDCTRGLGNFRAFMLYSVAISLAGLAVVFLIMLFVSGRVMGPVAESYEKQRRFITDAGHEIKTPIAIINADAEVIELENGYGEWTEDIKAQTKRLATLTEELIFLSRMDEESPRISMIELPFSDIVEEAVKSFEAPARMQNRVFNCAVEPGISLVGDERGLRQLVNILIDNAIKYSGDEGVISVTAERHGRGARLTVENSVDSVDKAELSHMFDRFYRGDKSRSSEKSGYGLGLSIAKAVTEAHRGKITADSPDGKTVRITVTL